MPNATDHAAQGTDRHAAYVRSGLAWQQTTYPPRQPTPATNRLRFWRRKRRMSA